jgi:glucose-6-phosphate 1-dehydrogenase
MPKTKNKKQGLPPTILTIFGITGDLSRRKLLPALYYLADDNLLPSSFKIVGVTRHGTTTEEVIETIKTSLKARHETCHQHTLDKLQSSIIIETMDITTLAPYKRLKTKLDAIEDEDKVCMSRIFYLAMPAQMFKPVTSLLDRGGLNDGCQHGTAESRLLLEKPIGHDLHSATDLIDSICKVFHERQLYLIDHYLAKPAVQELLAFKVKLGVTELIWDAAHVSRIVISADESLGIEGRIVFYEQMGALCDFVQSHLMQLLTIVTMDRPVDVSAEAIHAAKLQLLEAVTVSSNNIARSTVHGQYQGYPEEVNNPNSRIETFAAIKLAINNERWQGVPIILRTGKKLKSKTTKIALTLKLPGSASVHDLIIHIEPQTKGTNNIINSRDDYEQMMINAINGDKTLFATKEEVLASWRIITPILKSWANDIPKLVTYKPTSNGPIAYEQLLGDDS